MEKLGYKVALILPMVMWNSALTEDGERCAGMTGISMRLELCAVS